MVAPVSLATAILPVPTDYQAGSTAKWLFTLWAGGFALLVLPYCLYRIVRYRDPIALLAWVGGFIVSLGEPMLDTLGHLWWPTNLPGPAFTAFHLDVPLLIPPCYVFFVAMTGYFAYRMFLRGLTVGGVFLVWGAIACTDLLLEFPGVLADVYRYYGTQPFYFGSFPLHWAWLNGTGMLCVGFVLWLVVPRLHGWQLGLVVLAPTVGFLGSYGITAWPAFLALNADVSKPVMHAIDLLSLALCLLVVWAIANVVARRSDAPPSVGESGTADPADALVGSGR